MLLVVLNALGAGPHLAGHDVGCVLVAGGGPSAARAGRRPDAVHVVVDLLRARGTHDDAVVARADAAEEGGEPEAEDDRDQDRAEVVLHDALEDHGRLVRIGWGCFHRLC